MASSNERYLYVNNVARRLNVSERTVRYWAANGRIPAIRIGVKIWRFRPIDIEFRPRSVSPSTRRET